MSKTTEKQQELESLNQKEKESLIQEKENSKETQQETLSENQNQTLDKQDKKPKSKNSNRLLSVEQFLRRAKMEGSVADLIRSLYRMKAFSFAEWVKETRATLNKQVW